MQFLIVCMPDCASRAGTVGAAQAGRTLKFLVSGDPTVRQLIPAFLIEAHVLLSHAYAH